jgi:1-phosphofructokinase
VFYREGEEVLWGRAAADPVRSTSGCGDALLAGVVSSLLTRRTWDETVRWSIATATATAEIFGTGFPTVEHIKQVLPRVVVESL